MSTTSTYRIGQTAELRQVIGERELSRFVELTGDDNPIHTDESYAEGTKFKTRVMHGMLGASFISTIIGKHLPGEGSLWISQKLNFHSPVFINDELLVRAEIIEINDSHEVLTIKIEMINQLHQLVTSGECKVKVLEKLRAEVDKPAEEKGVVIVTGGSSGIGSSVSSVLALSGYKIAIIFRENQVGAQGTLDRVTKAGAKANIFQLDVASKKQIDSTFRTISGRLGAICGLVNAASPRIVEKGFDELTWEDIEAQMAPQFQGAFNCIKAIMPYVTKDGASIVNIGSIVTESMAPPNWIAYTLAKHGIHGLTKTLAEPLGLKNIRINTVAPGLTNTRFVAAIPERIKLATEMQTPLRRLAEPQDIAEAVCFLISKASKHITGSTLRVNGGKTLL